GDDDAPGAAGHSSTIDHACPATVCDDFVAESESTPTDGACNVRIGDREAARIVPTRARGIGEFVVVTNVEVRTASRGPRQPNTRLRWLAPVLVIGAFLIVGGSLGGVGGQLDSIQRNDAAAYLPASAEATKVLNDSKNFTGESTAAIIVYRKATPITDDDKREIVLTIIR